METKVVSRDSSLDKLSEKLYLNGHLDFEKGNRGFAGGGGGGGNVPLGFWAQKKRGCLGIGLRLAIYIYIYQL